MLYVCATPIGNLGDVTPRVLDALRAAELVAAEDTRRTRKLLSHFDIHTPLTSFFQHNELQKTDEVMRLLRDGRTVALVTDAGMPGVQDPGMLLVHRVVAESLEMTVLPGPSAVLTALVASGLDGEGFRFVGYLPRRSRELEAALVEWRRCGGILIAFDTGQRLARSLATLAAHLPDARAAVCRELTKVHEEVSRGSVYELSQRFPVPSPEAGPTASVRGEITLVIDVGRPLDADAARLPDAATAAERDALRATFAEQAGALVAGGVDLLNIETMFDLTEATIAVEEAVRAAGGRPVLASMAYKPAARGFRTMMGVTPEQAASALTAAGADLVGCNCEISCEPMAGLVPIIAGLTGGVTYAQPNAGQPRLVDGETVYEETPEHFAAVVATYPALGAGIVGGCCGTPPASIAALAAALGR